MRFKENCIFNYTSECAQARFSWIIHIYILLMLNNLEIHRCVSRALKLKSMEIYLWRFYRLQK